MKQTEEIILKPMHRLPIVIIFIGLSIILIPSLKWLAISIVIFGFFLLIQSFTLKIKFTDDDFIVLQLGRQLRCFPFKDWLAWRIFLPGLPGILYFREQASPHLLPILFDIEMLEQQLKLRVGSKEITNTQGN